MLRYTTQKDEKSVTFAAQKRPHSMKRLVFFVLACLLVAISPARADIGRRLFTDGWTLNGFQVSLPCTFPAILHSGDSLGHTVDSAILCENHFEWDGNTRHKLFIEFEGVGRTAEVSLNGHLLGRHVDDGSAFGFDLTPYLYIGDNLISLRTVDEQPLSDSLAFRASMCENMSRDADRHGIFQRVWLCETDLLHQTAFFLGGMGPSVYADQFDFPLCSANIHYETEVLNEDSVSRTFYLRAEVYDAENNLFTTLVEGMPHTLAPNEKATVFMSSREDGICFWNQGRGYLYTVCMKLVEGDNPWAAGNIECTDLTVLHTGFRKAEYRDGGIYLNDSLISLNVSRLEGDDEWLSLGVDVPEWLRDYRNAQFMKNGKGYARLLNDVPSVRDIESCDREGILQILAVDSNNYEAVKPLIHRCFDHPSVLCCMGDLDEFCNDTVHIGRLSYPTQQGDKPNRLKLTAVTSPQGFCADGHDVALIQVEAYDKNENPCPLDSCVLEWSIEGPAEWVGRMTGDAANVVVLRSTSNSGTVLLKVKAPGIRKARLKLKALPVGSSAENVSADHTSLIQSSWLALQTRFPDNDDGIVEFVQ